MFQIIWIDANGNADAYAAGDPTPGRGANEFVTRDEAENAVAALGEPGDGCEWSVRERKAS